MRLIQTKDQLKEYIEYERKIYGVKVIDDFLPFKYKETQILWNFVCTLRRTEYHVNTNHRIRGILYKFKLNGLRNKYGLHIPINVVGKGLSLGHLGSVIINNDCKIGNDFRTHVGVNIGSNHSGGGAPSIGNNVYVGPGAKIFGNIKIADNVKIGANAVVNKSFVEEGITIVGVPANKVNKRD